MSENLSGIIIQIPSPTHRDGILNLIQNVMLPQEPIEKVMGFKWDEVRHGWEEMVDDCIQNGHCHVAIEEKSGQIVGARMGRILDSSSLPLDFGLYDWMDGPSDKSHAFASAFNELTRDWRNVLVKSNGQKCQKILQFMTLCVNPDFGKRGIGLTMSKENIDRAKLKGADYCTCVATNWLSQRVFEKLGFRTAGDWIYLEHCNKDGKPIFDIRDPENPDMKWMVKEL